MPATRTYKTTASLVTDRLRQLPADGGIVELPALRIDLVRVEGGTVRMLRLHRKPS